MYEYYKNLIKQFTEIKRGEYLKSASNSQNTAGYVSNLQRSRGSPNEIWEATESIGDDVIQVETSCSTVQYTFETIKTQHLKECSVDFVAVGKVMYNMDDDERNDLEKSFRF